MVTYFQDTIFDISPTLTAPGNGNLLQVAVNNTFSTQSYTLIVIVANVNSHVDVSLDGSIDGTNFVPIIASQRVAANGASVFSVTGRPVKWIRPVFITESGGTDATVSFQVAAA